MEEQPKDRAQERRYYHHGEERNPIQYKTSLKNDQISFQYQHQETQTKKTGNGKINTGEVEGEKILSAKDFVGIPLPTYSNGNRHLINANVKQKSKRNVFTTLSKVGCKEGLVHKKNMDRINDKAQDFTNHYEGKFLDKKESALFLNGVVNSAHITNGYSSKSPPDNDGSGSEGGYTTPKKRKTRRNSIKNTEHVTRERERVMQQGNATQEPEVSELEPTEKLVSSRIHHKADAQTAVKRMDAPEVAMGELQKKNSDSKTAAGAFGKKFENRPKAKLSSSSKEDSWTLFKPPPVFPVDNSSAKIVPKISYASKVKENLNKAEQAGGEVQTPQVPGRLSQVPMSAMKTIISASFTNGPVSGDGNSCPSVGTFFTPAASSIPPATSLPCGENVASTLDNDYNSLTNPAAVDLRKCTLFIYPLNPLNMQPVLPSARQVDTQAAQTNQKALGDIFQNQWGLSFINEPNVGPEGGSGPVAAMEGKAAVVTFQGEQCPAAKPGLDSNLSIPEPLPLTLAQDSEKRTSAPACPPATVKGEDGEKTQLSRQEKTKGEAKSPGAVLLASKDISAEPAQAPLTNLVLGLSKEPPHSKSLDRGSWGSFDLKAAVTYHTKEMEYVFNLQKQDPKRVVCYDKTKDGPYQ
ncbi:nuclear fragile X mental retardation-interacting protein 2-like isoform X1 [Oncorhynchus kisutch]|uniref:nuclear fragile X mental retardation-interacting protein 2-like isoform X1 n=1 Tax=Oncorhynchus kisutch TaxID=8019 RepID=UPI0012DDFAF3|nr:nuclear fragile X mental retardation-interacting protein 2-like isoform X1 [Oncorhynchus kisutch]